MDVVNTSPVATTARTLKPNAEAELLGMVIRNLDRRTRVRVSVLGGLTVIEIGSPKRKNSNSKRTSCGDIRRTS